MIQELESNFIGKGEVKGFRFEKLRQTKDGYIYQVISDEKRHYEVFRKKVTPVCINFEKREYSETDFKVKYPKSRDFGVSAWCVSSLKRADEKLKGFTA